MSSKTASVNFTLSSVTKTSSAPILYQHNISSKTTVLLHFSVHSLRVNYMENKPFNVFILSGPSGAGEDSVIKGLEAFMPIERVITTTTRAMRSGECQGNPYYFVSKTEFEEHIKKNAFIEYAQEYNGQYYGVTKPEIDRVLALEKIGIWKIEWKGVITAKKLFPNIIAIFLTVSDLSILEKRIRRRNPEVSEEYLAERRSYTEEWMQHKDIYDYTVYNEEGHLDETIQKIKNIILTHHPL